MPKTCDFLAPLCELQTKAEDLVSKMDAAIFDRLGIFITDEVEVWKATFEMNLRQRIQSYRLLTLGDLLRHSERARTLEAPVRLEEEHAELVGKLTALNVGLEKLFDIFHRTAATIAEDDPRQDLLCGEMLSIQSNIELVKEGEKELQDKFPAMKRALQFLVLPKDRFEAFVDPLQLQPEDIDLRLLNPKVIRLAKYWHSRHQWFKEIQNVLADAATRWLDQHVMANQQRKVLRAMQKLYRQLQAQVDKQDILLTDIEEYREWAVEAPIFLAYEGLGTIEVTQLLSALEEYKDVTESSLMFSALNYLLEDVNTSIADLEEAMDV